MFSKGCDARHRRERKATLSPPATIGPAKSSPSMHRYHAISNASPSAAAMGSFLPRR